MTFARVEVIDRRFSDLDSERSGDPAEAEVLDLEKFLEPVLRSLAAEPRFLYAAERRDFGRDEAGVDPDDAVLERFGDAPDARDVAAVEVRGEAELGVVGERDGLRLVAEAEERRHRPEGFLARDGHRRRHARENRRLEEAAAERMACAAYQHFRALRPPAGG